MVQRDLVGRPNETDIILENLQCKALLDTGSTVSTICQSFYEEHLKDIPLQTIDRILKVECAGGEMLPYVGYIEAELKAPDIFDKDSLPALFLIVPDTRYSHSVPVLLGTNVLQSLVDGCKESHGEKFLQRIAQHTPWWLTFRCISIQKRELTRANGKLGVVKSNRTETLTIPSNRRVTVTGYVSDIVPCNRALAMVQPTTKSSLPAGVEVIPHLVHFTGHRAAQEIQVEIANPTPFPITVQPRGVLGELQQVTVEESTPQETAGTSAGIGTQPEGIPQQGHIQGDPQDNPGDGNSAPQAVTDEEFVQQFALPADILTGSQMKDVKDLLIEYRDIFSEGDYDYGPRLYPRLGQASLLLAKDGFCMWRRK